MDRMAVKREEGSERESTVRERMDAEEDAVEVRLLWRRVAISVQGERERKVRSENYEEFEG